jgi:hypothetical protein
MNSLLTRAQSRLYRHTPEGDGIAPTPATPHCPRWLAAMIGAAVILIATVTVAISLTSGADDEPASAGTTGATSTSTSETTSPPATDRATVTVGPEPATGAASPAPAPAPTPSAAADLADFFTAVDRVDQRLEAAADQYNASVGPDTVEVDEATLEAVRSIDPGEAAAAIPPGLPPDLLLKVLIVQDNLITRTAALEGAVDYVKSGEMADALRCLKNGNVKAGRFDSEVAAAKALAGSSPPIVVAAPDSRAAGDLALRLSIVLSRNYGCGACGGEAALARLEPITWYDEPAVGPETGLVTSGTVDLGGGPIGFSATYTPGAGWEAHANAC